MSDAPTNRINKQIQPTTKPFFEKKKIRVCAYVRVSTGQQEQLYSLENQKQYYERKIQQNPDYEYKGIFVDAGISGSKENRPEFQRMIEEAKAGNIDLIVTKSISRFARNTVHLLKYVRELKEVGVGVIFEEQNINTLNSEGELMLTVLGAIAEEERKNVSSNLKWSVQNKFKRGEPIVDLNRLIGYDKGEDGSFVINKEQAKIVRQIYKLYLSGLNSYEIANELNVKDVPTYTKKPWDSSRILSIISNEKYVGDCLMQKNYITEDDREILNRGERIKYYVRNHHAAIIKRSDWEKAQTIREDRKRKTYPFSGMLRCSYCGASLIRVRHQGRWVSWICGTFMRKGKATCKGMRISEGRLQEVTRGMNFKEPMVIEEVTNEQCRKKRSEKD